MVSCTNYKVLNASEDFVIVFFSKLNTYFIDGYTLGMKFQPIFDLLGVSEQIDWILDLESEVHPTWVCG